jgi:hypothetical protein
LPPDFDPVDATPAEVASWRRESEWTVHKKIREGVYQSYLDKTRRKLIFASVKADRDRAIKEGATLKLRTNAAKPVAQPVVDEPEVTKRRVGRPRKEHALEAAE